MKTNLQLYRKTSTANSIIGELYVNGTFQCFTLEGTKTFFPAGTYEVKVTYSPRFKRNLPELLNVPGREYIRIHGGNEAKDTEGCILVGQKRDVDCVEHSQDALTALLEKLKGAAEISITVV